jgi:acyl-CoA thioester hydrolase
MTLLNGMSDSATPRRANFRVLRTVPTRWSDNDHYGHTTTPTTSRTIPISLRPIEATGTDFCELPAIGIAAETGCRFLNASFPDSIHAGLAVERLGTTSVVYRIALFRNDEETVGALGVSCTSTWIGSRAGRCRSRG